MFSADTVSKAVETVANDLNIDDEKDSISAKEVKELISRSIYKCLVSTDFERSMAQTIVSKIRRP